MRDITPTFNARLALHIVIAYQKWKGGIPSASASIRKYLNNTLHDLLGFWTQQMLPISINFFNG